MATVQLVEIREGVALVQRNTDTPVEMTWSLLHEAQGQEGPAGHVYRWLMRQFVHCEYEQRQGRPWTSPRRTIEQIVAEMRDRDAREAMEVEQARQERDRREDEELRRREHEDEMCRVEAERRETAADAPWWPIPSWEVPDGVRFDVPARNQGQIVEVAYGTFGRSEAGAGDPYMQVYDRSDRSCRTYQHRQVGE